MELSTQNGCFSVLRKNHVSGRGGESSLNLGVGETYIVGLVGITESWHEKLKPTETPPKLKETFKAREN